MNKKYEWFLSCESAIMMELPYSLENMGELIELEKEGYLFVYRCENKKNHEVIFVYNENRIPPDYTVSVYIFRDATGLVEFLCHKNYITKEKELELLGFPQTSINDILEKRVNSSVYYKGFNVPCNKVNEDKVAKELMMLYGK